MSEHVQTRSSADFPRPHDRLPGTFRPVSTRQIREKVREGSRVLFPLSRFPEMCHAANGSKVDERFTRAAATLFISEASRSSYFHELFDGRGGMPS